MPISSGLNNDVIRVGIVLPEDKLQNITLSWTPEMDVSGSISGIEATHQLKLSVKDGSIVAQGLPEQPLLDKLTLNCNDQVETLSTGYGIHVDPVIAGRGFHWEKQIAVDLPGQLNITVEDDCFKVINTLNIEAYVACVATSEMGSEAPADLLAAQTVVARCWSMALAEAKHLDNGFDVCNDDCCQRYQGTSFLTEHSLNAAVETKGEVLIHQNRVIDARYSKNCGGMVEDYEAVWKGDSVPYLIPLWDGPDQRPGNAVTDFEDLWHYEDAYCASKRFQSVNLAGMLGKVDVSGSYYRWSEAVKKQDILNNLKKFYNLTWNSLDNVHIVGRGASARINNLILTGTDSQGESVEHHLLDQYDIRQMFSESFLYSSAFVIDNADTLASDDSVMLRGSGWGHGVGLCQMGALGMALDGISYKDILLHYYPGTELTTF